LHHISHIHFALNVTVNSKCKHSDGRLIVDQLEFLKMTAKTLVSCILQNMNLKDISRCCFL